MTRFQRVFVWVSWSSLLMFLLLVFEASGGHDGYLCEWGYDSDGAGDVTSGCG